MILPETLRRIDRGSMARRVNFGSEIYFFAPGIKGYSTSEFTPGCGCSFAPVSITGSACKLMCDHCRGEILRTMEPALSEEELLAAAAGLKGRGAGGILISGGSGSDGVVPLRKFLPAMSRIREALQMSVIAHTAITDAALARGLAGAQIEAALIDIAGSDSTIRDVFHLPEITTVDYERSMSNLVEAGVPLAPHVVIGIDRGRIEGETRALEMISGFEPYCVVLVGLLPLRGTPMEKAVPPDPAQFGEIFLAARELMPRTPILLGCERPAGDHRRMTEQLALRAGLNGIAYPSEGIIGRARQMGLTPVMSESCCALMPGLWQSRRSPLGRGSAAETEKRGKLHG